MFKLIKHLLGTVLMERTLERILSDNRYECRRLEGEIVRNTHSIEKGLSLESVRLGFGYQKMTEAFGHIDRYIEIGGDVDAIPVRMFAAAVVAYLEFHEKRNYMDEHINEIREKSITLNAKLTKPIEGLGGYKEVKRENFTQAEQEVIKKLFVSRHSVREFAGTPVDNNKLQQAIEMACHCPSACNRQCYRVYIVDKSDFNKLEGWLDGVGGFADELDKILIVTGNMSVYRRGERYQFAVTGSVFASYLTLSLEAMNIGCCFMQRPIFPNKKWIKLAKSLHIPGDEQVVCALGIGNFKDSYKVPVSYRFPDTSISTRV